MKISARNKFQGKIKDIQHSSLTSRVILSIGEKSTLVASISRESFDKLSLSLEQSVLAFVKAPQIIIVTNFGDFTISACNQLHGTVESVQSGAINSEVVLKLAQGDKIVAVVTNESVENLDLVRGKDAVAIFKSESVMLAKERLTVPDT